MEHVTPISEEQVSEQLRAKLARYFGVKPEDANDEQIYKATLMSVKDVLTEKRQDFHEKAKKQSPKKVYYL